MRIFNAISVAVIFFVVALLGSENAVGQTPEKPREVPAQGEILYSPKDAARFAAEDLMGSVPPELRQFTRYISLYNIPEEARSFYQQTISFVLNSISRNGRVVPVHVVPNTDNTLLRVNLIDYKYTSVAWDNLAQGDPFFSATLIDTTPVLQTVTKTKKVQVRIPGTTRTEWKEQEYKEQEEGPSNNKIRSYGPWIVSHHATILSLNTVAKSSAILRGDWFIVKATVPPAYYEFLGLGNNEAEFQKAVGLNEETLRLLRTEYVREARAAVIRSGVTRNNRRLGRLPGPFGYFWFSSDTLTNINQQNYTRILLTDDADASEQIASAPNGLQWYFVVNKQRKRLDEADINIAIDNNFPDHKVITGRSCMVCHSTGILSFKSSQQSLVRDRIKLESSDPLIRSQLLNLYGNDLTELFAEDQARYAKAVKRTNGLTPEVNARQFKDLYLEYSERDLTLEDAARELGASAGTLREVFSRSTDPVLLGLINRTPEPARREHWEEIFPVAIMMLQDSPKQR